MKLVGEKAFLSELLPRLNTPPSFVSGFGHDAAVVDVGLKDFHLITAIDRAAQPMAAVQGWSDFKVWGRLAVTSNCSDILASGGMPMVFLLAMCLPGEWSTKDAEDIVLGCQEECERNGVVFAGGDTKETHYPEIVGSVVGLIRPGAFLPRTEVRPGQSILIAGSLGGCVASYLLLQEQYVSNNSPPLDQANLWYLTHPCARWLEGRIVRELGVASAGMDTSDGLYATLVAMTEQRGLGAELFLDSLPFHETAVACSRRLQIPLFNTALGVGDWNLVFAVNEPYVSDLVSEAKKANAELTVIGRFTQEPGITALTTEGVRYSVTGFLNEHFRSRMEDRSSYFDKIRHFKALTPLSSRI